ncbi:hypothetical protein X915_gp055 [Bacillus phage vB_BanS-Tsamsa]|uniref:Uncharacterized protein n=1 Tax=Bacillus phage vB_BanS-Tsamsa TaxID=1308863 RepID=U5J9L8_9CAUD|nr:hypothetical protein X915_gp055 [Bacillus phage vB_BanS-Tsamsa]AGI11978.1 hypothetical protein [Bacillus phage vB_BanS-Tsamsa]
MNKILILTRGGVMEYLKYLENDLPIYILVGVLILLYTISLIGDKFTR